MGANYLKLNGSKTETMIFSNHDCPSKMPDWPDSFKPSLAPVSKVRDLGVILDSKLALRSQVNQVPYITRQDTVMREAISAEQRLVATLRYLATGRSLQDLKFSTGISPQALGLIIPDTCSAIIQVLQDDYMRLPSTPQEWQTVAAEFETRWNFPNCGGAINGKHVRIVPPPRSGSQFYNYKGFNSIVLMAVVSAQYEFLYVDVGKNGRMSDGGAFRQTEFGERLQDEDLALPPDADNVEGLPFVFLADEAFGLGPHLMSCLIILHNVLHAVSSVFSLPTRNHFPGNTQSKHM
ncbi:uncharacterized protein LOC120930419 [Rana temporaria]|uniref:uncharacterized protein LOC120930419 n=1 Tax=Rana temporaria TaxID=8407 RepID=UPI001AAC6D19|nr:uncharacterized protein LOC120930419 [Rana temporaria]